MKIKIRFFGFLVSKIGKQIQISVQEKTTLGEVVAEIFRKYNLGHLDPKSPSARTRVTPGFLRVFLNGKETQFDCELKEGDEIQVFPPLVGGKVRIS